MWSTNNTYARDRGIAIELKPDRFLYMTHEQKNRQFGTSKLVRYLWKGILLSSLVYSLFCVYVYDIRKQTGAEFMEEIRYNLEEFEGKMKEVKDYFIEESKEVQIEERNASVEMPFCPEQGDQHPSTYTSCKIRPQNPVYTIPIQYGQTGPTMPARIVIPTESANILKDDIQPQQSV